ncbi:uncharacterized protein METZ01_LOCUS280664, partial [marine metagenome]
VVRQGLLVLSEIQCSTVDLHKCIMPPFWSENLIMSMYH